ncbi:MAG: hypothetical protein IKV03_03970 [Alphaproteobacteria bacterium]|nr:hypothetical protein [Alphaproteobacteria bacterium]
MNKDLMKMSILSFAIVMGMTGCDEDKPQKKALINNTPIATVTPNPEDTLVGTVIATKTYPNSVGAYGAKRLSHSLFFIDTDGDTKTAEYIGAIYYPDDNYIQGAGQAFNAERTGMKKTIAQWRRTLDYFQKIQKEKE